MDVAQSLLRLLRDSCRASFSLFKVMVPIMIAVKIFKELGLISYLAIPLAPAMELMGLPAEAGLVWATSMAANIYSGLVVYATLIPEMQTLTVAQTTVLSTIILIAHNLPVELRIAQKCGVSLLGQLGVRVGSALLAGLLLHWTFTVTGALQEPSVLLWRPDPEEGSYLQWAWGQAQNLGLIFLLILFLMALMRAMDRLGLTQLCQRLLRPALRFMGIGEKAATITIIGLVMGIAYGGGLIIHEAQSGRVEQKDIYSSLTLMGLSHAIIEDTLLMLSIGASMWGVLWARLLFSLAVVAVLARMYARLRPGANTA